MNKGEFLSRVQITPTCWNWKLYVRPDGYGIVYINRYPQYAHRYSYELFKEFIPDNYVIDHLCRNKKCVNPAHLEAVTQKENLIRGENVVSIINLEKTHCSQGHSFKPPHLYIDPNNGKRSCRTCANQRRRNKRILKKTYLAMKKSGAELPA